MVQHGGMVRVETSVGGLEPGLAKVQDLAARLWTELGALVVIERNLDAMDWTIADPHGHWIQPEVEEGQSAVPSPHDCVAAVVFEESGGF